MTIDAKSQSFAIGIIVSITSLATAALVGERASEILIFALAGCILGVVAGVCWYLTAHWRPPLVLPAAPASRELWSKLPPSMRSVRLLAVGSAFYSVAVCVVIGLLLGQLSAFLVVGIAAAFIILASWGAAWVAAKHYLSTVGLRW